MLRPQTLREANQWWQSLSVVAKIALPATTVIVVAVLVVWICAAYSAPPVASASSPTLTNDRASPSSVKGLLSLPLPGTRQRREVELAQRLQTALAGFDDIAAVQVVVGNSLSPTEDSSDSHRLSLQLRLSPTAAPTTPWIENLVTFVLHTIPGLRPADLLIADSSGRLLFADGQVVSPTVLTPPPSIADSTPSAAVGPALPEWQVTPIAAVSLVIILLLYALMRRRPAATEQSQEAHPAPTDESPTQAALQFLERLNSQQIVNLLEGERPEVADLVTHYLTDEDMVHQVRQELRLPASSPAATQRPVRDDVLTSLAAALRSKWSACAKTADNQLAAATMRPASGGDYDE